MLLTKSCSVLSQCYKPGAESGPASLGLSMPARSYVRCRYFPCQEIPSSQVYTCPIAKTPFLMFKTVCCIQPYHRAWLIWDTFTSTHTCLASTAVRHSTHTYLPSKAAQTIQLYVAGRLSCHRALLWYTALFTEQQCTCIIGQQVVATKTQHIIPSDFYDLKDFPTFHACWCPLSI